MRTSIEAGFLDGLGGLLIAQALGAENNLEKALENLQVYFASKEDKILFPGRMYYRFSSDLHTGTAGILLGLLAAKHTSPSMWLPLMNDIGNEINLLKEIA